MKKELVINYDSKGQSLEYWPKREDIKKHGFHFMDSANSEIAQIWLEDKQAKRLALAILDSLLSEKAEGGR